MRGWAELTLHGVFDTLRFDVQGKAVTLSGKVVKESVKQNAERAIGVQHVVTFGLEHRALGQIDAIGVDEIQYSKGHKYLTLVYQIDLGVTHLLWVGKDRTSLPLLAQPRNC